MKLFDTLDLVANVGLLPAFVLFIYGSFTNSLTLMNCGVVAMGLVTLTKIVAFVPTWLKQGKQN